MVERQKIELELQQHRYHLEQLVSDRTAELEASNKELESYSYSIAHDLRTPLRTIVSFSQILLSDAGQKLNEEELDSLQRVITSGKRMALLIDDILQLARLGRDKMCFTDVDLSRICNEVAMHLSQRQSDSQVRWKIAENVKVSGDQDMLTLLMENLCINALKYSSKVSHPIIEFGEQVTDKQSVYYLRDNGVGFEQQYAHKIFGIFQRLHPASEYEDTGIGLATVQRIVERHGGRVWAEGELNAGATIYFTLNDRRMIHLPQLAS